MKASLPHLRITCPTGAKGPGTRVELITPHGVVVDLSSVVTAATWRLDGTEGVAEATFAASTLELESNAVAVSVVGLLTGVTMHRPEAEAALWGLLRRIVRCGLIPDRDSDWRDDVGASAPPTAAEGSLLRQAEREEQDIEPLPRLGLAYQPPDPSLVELVRQLASDEPCTFDHDGNCQTHLSFHGGPCPHAWAREVLAAFPTTNGERALAPRPQNEG